MKMYFIIRSGLIYASLEFLLHCRDFKPFLKKYCDVNLLGVAEIFG